MQGGNAAAIKKMELGELSTFQLKQGWFPVQTPHSGWQGNDQCREKNCHTGVTRIGIINKKPPDKSGFVSLAGWEVPIHTCMDDSGIFPNLNVILGWEKVPVSAAPSADFLTLSPWGVTKPWLCGQSEHYGMHRTPSTPGMWLLAEGSGCGFRPGSPGTHVGLICCTSAQSGAQLVAEPAAPDRHQKEDPWWREKQAVSFLKITWISPFKPTLLPPKRPYFYLNLHLTTWVSRALLEPLRIAFTFVFFLT